MSIYVIADLHLYFSINKPMNIFGNNWDNHAEKIKKNWIEKVKPEDTVLIPGDFSWATYLEETYKDFEYLNELPGKKILLKGNHDYWWTTLNKMNNYIKQCGFKNINFLYNNSYLIENNIIAGTRGWVGTLSNENLKILKRENERLKLSIKDGIKRFGEDKKIIVMMHYPPFMKENCEVDFIKTMKDFNVSSCFYGHLHADSHKEAIEGEIKNIYFKLVSSDYMNFDLLKVD
ncbi:MAG: metallophosphoesterase [Candidatus Scatovivens sp.]